ncbi:DUF397 domain-containing protein [Actinomadura sp. LOL_016]|uniref:DUF397 domain-containing protein n=1 Tax=unclassified Actinomadura TaxID=2626254 RepID=UPI003A8038E7
MYSPNLSSATWRKSSRSNGAGGACVEVADLTASIGVRDSKAPGAGHLSLTTETWAAFVAEVRGGQYDLR